MSKQKIHTQAISDTQLLVASAAAVLSAGLAFLAAPISPKMDMLPSSTMVSKCEVQSFSVQESTCFQKGLYSSAEVVCGDGKKITLAQQPCSSPVLWEHRGVEVCKSRCVRSKKVTSEEDIFFESEQKNQE